MHKRRVATLTHFGSVDPQTMSASSFLSITQEKGPCCLAPFCALDECCKQQSRSMPQSDVQKLSEQHVGGPVMGRCKLLVPAAAAFKMALLLPISAHPWQPGKR